MKLEKLIECLSEERKEQEKCQIGDTKAIRSLIKCHPEASPLFKLKKATSR